jgi:hypothetical protein
MNEQLLRVTHNRLDRRKLWEDFNDRLVMNGQPKVSWEEFKVFYDMQRALVMEDKRVKDQQVSLKVNVIRIVSLLVSSIVYYLLSHL